VPRFLAGTTQGQQTSETDQPLRSANSRTIIAHIVAIDL